MEPFARIKLSMEEIVAKISANDPDIDRYVPSVFKSPIWSKFKCIFHRGTRQDYAQCNACGKIMMHKARTGNSQLLRHKCGRSSRGIPHKFEYDENRRIKEDSNEKYIPTDLAHVTTSADSTDEVDRAGPSHYQLPQVQQILSLESPTCSIKTENDDGYETILHSPTALILSKEELVFKIAQKDPNISFVLNNLHPKFNEIHYCKERQNFCRCNNCGVLIERAEPGTSVAHFYRHKCLRQQELPPENLNTSVLLQAKLVYKSLRSPELFDDENFAAFCASLVDNQMQPELTNRSRMSNRVLPSLVETPKIEIATALEQNSFAFTYELWPRGDEKVFTLFGTCINQNLQLKHYCMGVVILGSNDENYDAAIDKILEEYADCINTVKKKCIFVTDGTVCPKSLVNFPCTLNLIEKILRDFFASKPLKLPKLQGLKDLITLTQSEHTSNNEDTNTFLETLKIFKEMAYSIAMAKETTIDTIFLWKIKLLKHFSPQDTDSKEVSEVKQHMIALIQTHYEIKDLHKIAVFLNPKFKHLKFVQRNERAAFEDLVVIKINEILAEMGVDPKTFEIKTLQNIKSEDVFAEFMEANVFTLADSLKNEVRQYIDSKLSGNGDLLPYWANSYFEDLKRLVRTTLMIPACSMHSRIWNLDMDETFVKRRNNLDLDDIQNIIFLFHNMP